MVELDGKFSNRAKAWRASKPCKQEKVEKVYSHESGYPPKKNNDAIAPRERTRRTRQARRIPTTRSTVACAPTTFARLALISQKKSSQTQADEVRILYDIIMSSSVLAILIGPLRGVFAFHSLYI